MAIQKETRKIIKKAGNTIGLTYLLLLILLIGIPEEVLKLPENITTVITIIAPYIAAELMLLIDKKHVLENITNHNMPMILKEIKNRLIIVGIVYILATANNAISLLILSSYIISSKIILNRLKTEAKKELKKNK